VFELGKDRLNLGNPTERAIVRVVRVALDSSVLVAALEELGRKLIETFDYPGRDVEPSPPSFVESA
jgi:hypothetical protein